MADRTEYERRKAENAGILLVLQRWWEQDSDARAQAGSYGEQVIRVFWDNGRVVGSRLEPVHVVKPGRHNLSGEGDGDGNSK